jgi:exodeoxyribonuclease V gamma subunit
MPGIHLYTSNRLEKLADALSQVFERPLSSPLIPEFIMIQSLGMKRWLSLELARRFGVWAHCRFLFPNEVIREVFEALLPGVPRGRFLEPEIMTWKIMRHLPRIVKKPGFRSLKNYFGEEMLSLKTYQLSAQIANVFDQYLTYRPEMILSWEGGKDHDWQAELWRAIVNGSPLQHPPALRESFLRAIQNPSGLSADSLPERISIFGVSALPPFHMEVVMALSEHLDVNIFHLNPSREYWAEVLSEREIDRKTYRGADGSLSAQDLHFEKGNSLLASMGQLGRDFLSLIVDYNPIEESLFEEPGYDSLLHAIQSDILNLVDRGDATGAVKGAPIPEDRILSDTSIRISSCHGPMREVEVLYDYLLDLFNREYELKPSEILIMTPDIETYTPYIQAVFNATADEKLRIPFTIAGRHFRHESRMVDAFMAVLELIGSRFEVDRILDILGCDDVRRRFDLLPGDMELIRRWVRDTRISWGIDGTDRSRRGLPDFRENTWRAGVERLLLGYAMPGRGEALFNGILPYDNIEGGETIVLGKCISFIETLFASVSSLEGTHSLIVWAETLLTLLESLFLANDETGNDVQMIRNVLQRLPSIVEESDFHEEIDLTVVRSFLEHSLSRETTKGGFITGGVTFCPMLPMSGIPFRVIAMIGMDDCIFPRASVTPGFDRIPEDPRRGDRSLRDEDRYLFLESILSARERLYISYTGQGIQDNSRIPPSVVVSELLDYIEGFQVSGRSIRDHVFTEHRLQGFSAGYFRDDEELFSYSEENFQACRVALADRRKPDPFITGDLPPLEGDERVLPLQDLIQFFLNPAKYLLTRRLGIRMDDRSSSIERREPIRLHWLDRYRLEQQICERFLNNRDIESLYHISRAEGILPHGKIGEYSFRSLLPDIEWFSRRVRSYMSGERLKPIEVDLDISGYRLIGTIDDIWGRGMLQFRYARGGARDRLRAWIMHLAFNASSDEAQPLKSFLVCKDHLWETGMISESREILGSLISIYSAGITGVLCFFPETSLEYARAVQGGALPADALRKAMRIWEGSDYSRGEGQDPYYELLFRERPLGEEFADISQRVYKPLLAFQRESAQ